MPEDVERPVVDHRLAILRRKLIDDLHVAGAQLVNLQSRKAPAQNPPYAGISGSSGWTATM